MVTGLLDGAGKLVIKWPNDLLWRRAKLAGVLLERHDKAVIVGVGINATDAPPIAGRETISLADLGIRLPAEQLLHHLAQDFASWLSIWRTNLAEVRHEWCRCAHPVGTALTIHLPREVVLEGLFDGLDPDGALLLRLASGERRVIHAADVFLV